ncbi:HEAT repeat-containing protein 6-like isoform X2 [Tachypleus tridentatus]|uniref:HEAT repeat-containing protein 6-like isoform X2 n=1 Tax=Tachypleus tridentatus TaxID=6853 RepID=UPI003FD07662
MASSCGIIRDDQLLDHQKEVLCSCMLKLENLIKGNEEIQKNEINAVLDELNGLTYTIVFFSTEEAEQLLQICFLHVPFTSEHLVSKLCHLVTNILTKQQVECRSQFLHMCLNYFTGALQICGTWVTSDVLDTLAVLVSDNVGRIEQYWENLIGPRGSLLVFADPTYPDPDICLSSLKCLQNVTLRTQDESYPPDDWIGGCFSLMLNNLFTSRTSVDEITRCKLLIPVLRGIKNVVSALKKVPSLRIGDVLGGLKAYLFYGLPGFVTSNPTCLYPTPVSQFVPSLPCVPSQISRTNTRTGNQKKRTKKKRDVRKGSNKQSQKDDEQLSKVG